MELLIKKTPRSPIKITGGYSTFYAKKLENKFILITIDSYTA
jgi:hypothetical protein